MPKHLELGVFMPIANNGWIISENAPQYLPSWELSKEIGQYAESIGFDFLFSMIKWRGFGGATQHWEHSLESVSLMSGLAAVTERVKIIASMQPLIFNPAVAAKMAATATDISGGRFGINLVTGTYFDEYAQMGVLPEGYGAVRYDYAQEWIDAVKALWTNERVTYRGQHFQLEDCAGNQALMKGRTPTIVCAGMSDRGMAFTAENGDLNFLTGTDYASLKAMSLRSKEIAAGLSKSTKTATVLVVVIADTDEEAAAQVESYRDGVDVEAWKNIYNIYAKDGEGATAEALREQAKKDVFFAFLPVYGSPETVAKTLTELAVDGDLDAVLMTFPDYIEGLRRINEDVKPIMEKLGVTFSTTPALA
ncbi:LLM class flavin-dependent oxidoreductase [Paenarthrobacter nicotinovorans]|uniref:LLM class flavin-dependent oxidoreductase n=1 Tax=Paenarthrobacter nicotinovorans TaxID=29320 RepID=UPI003822EA57